MLERTLVLLKPDALQRGLVGEIIGRFEKKGLKLAGLKMAQFPRQLIERHYADHREKPFFKSVVDFMTSGPAIAIVLEGVDAIEVTREMMGKTSGRKSPAGTIRGDLCMSFSKNLVHGSDSAAAAGRELGLFFGGEGEIVEWTPSDLDWRYNRGEELR